MKRNACLSVVTILCVSAFAVFARRQIDQDRDPGKLSPALMGIGGHPRPLEILSQELDLLEAIQAKDSKIGTHYIQISQSYPPYSGESRAELKRQFAPIGILRIEMRDGSITEMDLMKVRKVILSPTAEFDIKKKPPSRFGVPGPSYPK